MSMTSQPSRVSMPCKRVAVAVVDFAGGERRPDRFQFVAGREERDAKLAIDADLAYAQRCDHAELRRVDSLAGAKHELAGLQIFAGETPVGAQPWRARPARRARRFASSLARSCMTTVSAPCGITPPVNMRTHSPGAYRARPRLAGERLADPLQHRLGVGLEISEAHRVAVHRRIVVTGHGDRRNHVGGEHAAERASNMHTLDRVHRRQERPD